MKIDLNGADWHLTGTWPWAPVLGKSLETGGQLRGLTPRIPAKVPGSVYADLLESGIIADPYVGMNSLLCEWVESKWWDYDASFQTPAHKGHERVFLHLDGLDYRARIYLNQKLLCIHEGMFLPLSIDVTERLVQEGSNELHVLFEETPREIALGQTSQVHTQKSRFGYKWDFGTRLVNVGIWDDVYLQVTGSTRLISAWARTDFQDGLGKIDVQLEADGKGLAEVALYTPDGKLLVQECAGIKKQFSIPFLVENPTLWQCGKQEKQPLYRVNIRLYDESGLSDESTFLTGIRSISFRQNEGAPKDTLPYTLVLNGERIYLKGVNITPFDHLYGCVSKEKYRQYVCLLKKSNVNLVRIWGGGLIEKEYFYRLCDENGILIWQEFIQSSSGVENVPPTNEAFLEELEKTSRQAIKARRGHVCLVIWCGGNELRERAGDDMPVTMENRNISLLGRLVAELDDQRLFLPSSASGPEEFITQGGHDVHGLWRYDGTTSHYTLYNTADRLLHSEFGVDGMSSIYAVQQITNLTDPPITDTERDLVWRFHGEWWDNLAKNQELFGEFSSLAEFVACSQLMQAEGVRYIVEEGRRRAFRNSGTMVWQFNEPWPNVSCTNLVEYTGRPKGAYYFVGRAYEPAAVSLRYHTITPQLGELFSCGVFLVSEECRSVEVGYELLDSRGGCIKSEITERKVQGGKPEEVFSICMKTPETADGLFFVRVCLLSNGERFFENTYFFSTAGEQPFAPLRKCRATLRQVTEGDTIIAENTGEQVAAYVHLVSAGAPVIDGCWSCIFPGETRRFSVSGGGENMVLGAVNA